MYRCFLVAMLLLPGSAAVHAVGKISVQGLFKDRAIVELDGTRRVLSVGSVSPEGVKLISANSREAVLEIDGKRRTYTLGTRIGSTYVQAPVGALVTIAPDRQGMYLVNGSINNYQVRFVVDTGATLISMSKRHAKRFGIDYKMIGLESVSSTASGIDRVYLVTLGKVKVGDIEVLDVKAAVHDGDFPEMILLGNSFLNRISLQRDGRLLKLEKKL